MILQHDTSGKIVQVRSMVRANAEKHRKMIQFVSKNLWPTIQKIASTASRRRVAVAYVTDDSLLPLSQDDVLIVDASDSAISGGRTDAKTLERYLDAGVQMTSIGNLHAKVIILDDIAIVGSGNVSWRSAHHYIEAATMSDRPELRGQAEQFVNSLLEAPAAVKVDRDFVDRILKIEVIKRAADFDDEQSPSPQVRTEPTQYWLAQTWESAEYPGDDEKVDAECQKVQQAVGEGSGLVYWFWASNKCAMGKNARVGDVVIETWREHRDISSDDEITAYKHAVIASIYQEDGQSAKTFHCVYPRNWEKTAISWSQFKDLAERAAIRRKLRAGVDSKLTERESSALFDLWPEGK
jgi:hypothetical protein